MSRHAAAAHEASQALDRLWPGTGTAESALHELLNLKYSCFGNGCDCHSTTKNVKQICHPDATYSMLNNRVLCNYLQRMLFTTAVITFYAKAQ